MSLKEIIEAWQGDTLENLLRDLYINKNMSIRDVADALMVSAGRVHRWLKEFGISKNDNLF